MSDSVLVEKACTQSRVRVDIWGLCLTGGNPLPDLFCGEATI